MRLNCFACGSPLYFCSQFERGFFGEGAMRATGRPRQKKLWERAGFML
jgi:hypothetical protein